MPADTTMPELARVPGVELARAGSWAVSTGSWDAKREDFVAAVAATNCPAVRRAVIRPGHVDPRFDGEPALGYIDNLRVGDGGHTLIGDLVGLPDFLPKVMAAAYPDRSVEGMYGYRCAIGHTHPFVLTGLALLGVTPPGVGTLTSLQDHPAFAGVAAAEPGPEATPVSAVFRPVEPTVPNVVVPLAAAVGVSKDGPHSDHNLREYWVHGKGALKIRWGVDGDFMRCVRELGKYVKDPKGLCAEYHHEALGAWPGREHPHASTLNEGTSAVPVSASAVVAAWNATAPFSQWVTEVDPDLTHVVVVDDVDRTYRRVPVTVSASGEVTFGTPTVVFPVAPTYADAAPEPVAASRVVFASREESRPESGPEADPAPAEPSPTVPAEPAPAVEPATAPATPNVPAAEPEMQVTDPNEEDIVSTPNAEVRSRLGLDDTADDAAILAAIDALKSKADAPPAEPAAELVAAAAATTEENGELRKEVQVLASQVAQMSTELANRRAAEAATVKASVLERARDLGKFAPADFEQWSKDYDEAPAAVTRILTSIKDGAVVPVLASGHAGTGEETLTDEADAIAAEWSKAFSISQEATR